MREKWGPNCPQTAKPREDPRRGRARYAGRYGRGRCSLCLPARAAIPVEHGAIAARPHRPHLGGEVWTATALGIIEVSRLSTPGADDLHRLDLGWHVRRQGHSVAGWLRRCAAPACAHHRPPSVHRPRHVRTGTARAAACNALAAATRRARTGATRMSRTYQRALAVGLDSRGDYRGHLCTAAPGRNPRGASQRRHNARGG